MNNKVSLLVNCLNEVDNLKNNILPLVEHFDETIIVDMQSNDGSRELFQTIPLSKFIEINKLGYVEPARKLGIDSCSYEFIFILDADETLSEKILIELKKFRNGSSSIFHDLLNKTSGIYIPRLNSMFHKDILWGKFSPQNDKQLRFFSKSTVDISDEIHHGIKFKKNINIRELQFSEGYYIYHYHSTSALQFITRIVRYSKYESNNREGIDSFNIKMAIRAFIREYIKNKGFMHGKVGFALAYILALREFLKGK
ncbi:glycosyltransferase [Providencia stuartii]|uniref:Glycosyltransferase, group 2 family protein n=1 Tax=Providencia stuartii ATCC 25827 TaxID=471874 RepID=A0AA86Z3K7_PROST|nr:glycosyltransferase [Providencia stuartii]EDU61614.1 glycosyltransferase, group 2 family protein [Providencia stuartii ATCC 25827]